MKILVIFTGGTIGSAMNESNYINTSENKKNQLLEMYNQYFPNNIFFDTLSPYTILSENLSGSNLNALRDTVLDSVGNGYDGIIITHGTDTLQYSAAFLGLTSGSLPIPVVLVSSNYILDDARANGLYNFAGAVQFISEGNMNGVFVSYTNDDNICYIHHGTRLLKHPAYSDNLFSVDNLFAASIASGKLLVCPESHVCHNQKTYRQPISEDAQIEVKDAFPGQLYSTPSDSCRAVFLTAYHSGTLCTSGSALRSYLKELSIKKIPVFLAGGKADDCYESVREYSSLGIRVLPKAAPIAMYVKLWIYLSLPEKPTDIYSFMCTAMEQELIFS